MHVIVGTDGSDEAVAAAARGVAMLGGVEKVTVVCVTDISPVVSAGHESGFAGGQSTEEEIAIARENAGSDAAAALERTTAAIDTTATVEAITEEGDAGGILCRLAADVGADAVVVGSEGKGAFKRALLGTVSGHVVNNAPCPVVVVRSGTA